MGQIILFTIQNGTRCWSDIKHYPNFIYNVNRTSFKDFHKQPSLNEIKRSIVSSMTRQTSRHYNIIGIHFLSQSNKLAINSWQRFNAKRSIKRAQSGETYWQLKLHNSETDRQVSIQFCTNYLLLRGTFTALFTKEGEADWKQKYDAFRAIKCKMELKCIPIAEISPSCRKSRSPNPSA